MRFLPALAAFVTFVLAVCAQSPAQARDDGLVLYGAGSLREAMTEMAAAFTRRHGTPVRTALMMGEDR